MQAFELSQLLSVSERTGVRYTEFLRHPSLSVGLYTLPAGSIDPQQPHTEDEVYYIVSGQGVIKVGNETRAVQEGSVIFVAAGASHHFHSITAHLTILVFFAPAEYTLAAKSEG
jgi:mannose-6-phosphate isomerase-like protein (cupin superfamily)